MGNFSKSYIVIKSISLYLFFYNIYEVQSDYEKCLSNIRKSFSYSQTPTDCLRNYLNRTVKPKFIPDNKGDIVSFLKTQTFQEKYAYYLSIYATYGHIKKPMIFCRLLYPYLFHYLYGYEVEVPPNLEIISIPTKVRTTDGEIIFDDIYEIRNPNIINRVGNKVVDQMAFLTPQQIQMVSDNTIDLQAKLSIIFRNDDIQTLNVLSNEIILPDEQYEKLVTLRHKCYETLRRKHIVDFMPQRDIFLAIYQKSHSHHSIRGYVIDSFLIHVVYGATLPDEVKNPEEYCEHINIIDDAIISTWDDYLNIPSSYGITSFLNSYFSDNNIVHRDVTVNTTPLSLNTINYAGNTIPPNTPNYAENTIPLNTPNYAGNTIPLNTPYYDWNNMPYNTTNNAWNNMPYNTTNDTENRISHISDTSTSSTINLLGSLDQKTPSDFREDEPPASSSNADWLRLWNK